MKETYIGLRPVTGFRHRHGQLSFVRVGKKTTYHMALMAGDERYIFLYYSPLAARYKGSRISVRFANMSHWNRRIPLRAGWVKAKIWAVTAHDANRRSNESSVAEFSFNLSKSEAREIRSLHQLSGKPKPRRHVNRERTELATIAIPVPSLPPGARPVALPHVSVGRPSPFKSLSETIGRCIATVRTSLGHAH